ncbi:pitrilysin family protein [Pedobacter gandavensis]|uniref:M16 family metallopeptidase n=1 Tax=Pedobacter gandavensis TaxID=2679963 RepID=UPI00292EB10A|nr:pitrilysin family protein [Pedobacter gandavensis]
MKQIVILIFALLFVQTAMAQKLDRSQRPMAGKAPKLNYTDPVIYKLSNGITVLVVENHKLPRVTASYLIDAGPVSEGSKAGKLSLMGQILNEGTISISKVEFDGAIDEMGAQISLSSSKAEVIALTRYFKPAFILMADALRKPALSQESLDKLKSQMITGLKANELNSKVISDRVTNALLFGSAHPLGEFETEHTINSVSLGDLKDAHEKYITPSRGYLIFVGNIRPTAAKALAESVFGDWKGSVLKFPVLAPVAPTRGTEIDVVDLPNAVQAEIKVAGLVSLPLDDPDYHAVLLANQILGGGAEARLFRNLREQHGFTYGAYSSIGSGRFQTTFSAYASVRNEKVDSAVTEFLTEIKLMCNQPVSIEELQNAKNLYNGSFALGLENPARMAGFAADILINDLPQDFYRTYLTKINAVTPEDILHVSKKYFNADQARIVIVGKKAEFMNGLKKMGIPVKLLDKFALPMSGM